MSRKLQPWETHPFFSAAEQVQDSADRLDSAYRALIHAKILSPDAQGNGGIDFYRRKLSTAFGIAKWQLEEFEKEVSMLPSELHVEDSIPRRHQQFVEVIRNQLSSIRNNLLSSKDQKDWTILTSINICQKESDELTHFLCGSKMSARNSAVDTSNSCSKAEMRYIDLATPASLLSNTSGMDERKGQSGNLDECVPYQELCTFSNANNNGFSSKAWNSEGNLVSTHDVFIDEDNHDSCGLSTSTPLRKDCYDEVNMCIERLQGYRSSEISLDRELSHHSDTSESTMPPKHASRVYLPCIWPSLLRFGLCVGSGVSQSVLKRLKDGDGDPLDLCQMCDDDIEADCSGFLCQRIKGSPDLQALQSSQKLVLTRQLVQKIIVALAVLVIVYIYF